MNLTFFPMHFSGLLGMPRRTYQYDANQGLELFNQLSTAGVGLLLVANLIFVFNFFRSLRGPMTAPTDPWGAPTIEWAIPSPPPEYNFARLPTITSRYPLWDLKSPGLTADVPHSKRGEKGLEVDVAGKDVGHPHPNPTGGATHNVAETAGYHLIERERYTARELGIPMPSSTAKPAATAFGILMMATGMLFKDHKDAVFHALLFGGAAVTIVFLYAWLTTPLEEHHH
jgi:cytochrome c oxidase subunit 1